MVKVDGFNWFYAKFEEYFDLYRDDIVIMKYVLDFLSNSTHEKLFTTERYMEIY